MKEEQAILERAEEHLKAAQTCLAAGLLNPAYELARTAAELYGKALILKRLGSYPRDHNVSGELRHRRLLPDDVSPTDLSKLLEDYTRGGYGFEEPVEAREARKAIAIATRLREEAERTR